MQRHLSVTESIFIARTPEDVWDYTQDYGRRMEWDASILEAVVLPSTPAPRVRVRARGGLTAVLQYKQFERAQRTSLALIEVSSWLIEGGGGSWTYEAREGGTYWTQVNTLVVQPGWWRKLIAPIVLWQLRTSTKQAMQNVKARMER